jgi:hypothetical protein
MNGPNIKWKLAEVLEREKITVYALNKAMGSSVSRNTLYRLSNEQPDRIDLTVTARILTGIEELTGKRFDIHDLLEYERGEG